ncbi:MAG: hypothetical protein QOF46_503, partial [Paraburkholderia sp.]|nr:hypothetical protein [Paraburkholderia sp.]
MHTKSFTRLIKNQEITVYVQ